MRRPTGWRGASRLPRASRRASASAPASAPLAGLTAPGAGPSGRGAVGAAIVSDVLRAAYVVNLEAASRAISRLLASFGPTARCACLRRDDGVGGAAAQRHAAVARLVPRLHLRARPAGMARGRGRRGSPTVARPHHVQASPPSCRPRAPAPPCLELRRGPHSPEPPPAPPRPAPPPRSAASKRHPTPPPSLPRLPSARVGCGGGVLAAWRTTCSPRAARASARLAFPEATQLTWPRCRRPGYTRRRVLGCPSPPPQPRLLRLPRGRRGRGAA